MDTEKTPFLLPLSLEAAVAIRDALNHAILSDAHITDHGDEPYIDKHQLALWHAVAAQIDALEQIAYDANPMLRDIVRDAIALRKDGRRRPQG